MEQNVLMINMIFWKYLKMNLNGYNRQRQKYMMLVEIQKHHHGERLQEDVKCLLGRSWLHCPVWKRIASEEDMPHIILKIS